MSTVPTVNSVVFDCLDAEALSVFWKELLDVGVRYRLPGFVWLDPQREGGYSVAFQEVADPTPGKNKLHLDGHCADLEAMTERVEGLGGRFVARHDVPGFVWNVYADPEDNQFCVGHEA